MVRSEIITFIKDNIMEMMMTMFVQLPDWIHALTGLVTSATVITSMTATRSDDDIMNWILKILNFMAGNFGHNTNKDA